MMDSLKPTASFLRRIDPTALVPYFAAYGLAGLMAGSARLFYDRGPVIITNWSWQIALVCSLACAGFVAFFPRMRDQLFPRWSIGFYHSATFALLLLLLTDFATRRFSFLHGGSARMELLLLAIIIAFPIRKSLKTDRDFLGGLFDWPVLITAQVVIAVLFLQYAGGRLIFSDDHPSFLYRLHLLWKHFPNIPFYNTAWDAGYTAREFFPTGALNIFLVGFPLLALFGDLTVYDNATRYTYFIPFLFVFLVPLGIYAASRLFTFSHRTAILAAIFSLGPSLSYFQWILTYGTIPFAFSAGLVPLALVLGYHVLLADQAPSWRLSAALLIVGSLCFAWTLSVVVFIPLALAVVGKWRLIFGPSRKWETIALLSAFLVVNGPWMITLVQESQVLAFINGHHVYGSRVLQYRYVAREKERKALLEGTAAPRSAAPPISTAERVRRGLSREAREMQDALSKFNPLIFLFSIPGLLALRRGRMRYLVVATLAWIFVISWIDDVVLPQLELSRMLLPGSFLICIMSAAGIVKFLDRLREEYLQLHGERLLARAWISAMVLFLVTAAVFSPMQVAATYLNRSDQRYSFAPPVVRNLSEAIKKLGGDGRTFFLGFILHEMGARRYDTQDGGHVAPLAAFSGKPLFASDFYHRRWIIVDPIPEEFRSRGPRGIEEFLDLVNTTAVVAFKREWINYCRSDPRYREVFHEDRFHLFRRDAPNPTYFLSGAGEVEATANGLIVRPTTEEAVVKFRYYPTLKIVNQPRVAGAELFGFPVFQAEFGGGKNEQAYFTGVRLPKESLGQKPEIEIRYKR